MSRNSRPRSTLPSERTIQPEFGARHRFVYNDELDFFFSDVSTAIRQVIPDEVTHDLRGRERRRSFFRVYDDPKRVGITVYERRMARNFAQRNRIRWTRNDVGRIKGEIQNEIARIGAIPTEATFTQAVRLGDIDEDKARKVGLILDQESELSEFVLKEHEKVANGISGAMMRRYKYPYDEYIPHWTVARIDRLVGLKGITRSIGAVQHLLPLTVQIEPIRLYSQQDLSVGLED